VFDAHGDALCHQISRKNELLYFRESVILVNLGKRADEVRDFAAGGF
jgi:hypothetical protein